MSHNDQLFRFLFENAPARAVAVRLEDSYQHVLQRRSYPPLLQKWLGELLAAAALIAANLKFDGALVMQLHGNGALKLLIVECDAGLQLRATARWDGDLADRPLAELLGQGKFVITLDPKDGTAPYQGLVALEGGSIATMIEHYMQSSAQIDTRVWLAADGEHSGGLLLQKLPEGHGTAEDWQRLQLLADTVRSEELATLAPEVLTHHLFHEEDRRVFPLETPVFHCSCSRPRVGEMLKMLDRAEVDSVLAEQGHVSIDCDFCNQHYDFDAIDVAQLFSGHGSDDTPTLRH